MRKFCLWILVCLSCVVAKVDAAEVADLFSDLPLVKDASVSPDGAHMAGVFTVDGKVVVMTSAFGAKETTPIVSLKNPADRIESVDWANNKRLLVTASIPQAISGSVYRILVTYAVDIDGSNMLIIENKSAYKKNEASWIRRYTSDSIVNTLADDDEHVIISSYDERDNGYALFKVNIYNSSFEKVESGAGDRYGFVTNRAGQAVFSLTQDKNDDFFAIHFKKPGTTEWKEIKKLKLAGDVQFRPVAIDGDNLFVITDVNSDYSYIARFDTKTGEISAPLYQEPGYDISTVLLDENEQLVGYFSERDFEKKVYISDAHKARAAKIDALLKGRENYITSISTDLSKVLIYSVTDHSPVRFYTIDFTTNKAGFWFSQYPKLEKVAMTSPQPIAFNSRDGKPLKGYLTLPAGDGKAPLIVFPHGGPTSRDYQEFNPWVQFLSRMGYAVLQVNFRGSEGFGTSHETAGYRQWGRLMQDDVMDGFNFVASNPRVDVNNACVVGASYGGYVALVAAFRDTEKFKCFVSISGISDLVTMIRQDVSGFEPRRIATTARIGDYEKDQEMLNSVSAINHIDKMKKPLLLVHGLKDTQVNYHQSTDLFEKMEAKDLPVQYVELKDGTHYFDEAEDRKLLFTELEAFLKKHLSK